LRRSARLGTVRAIRARSGARAIRTRNSEPTGGLLRKLLTLIVIVVVLIGIAGAYLAWTTPSHGAGMTYPLTASEQVLLGYIPAEAESFALIPTAAVTYAKLQANPIARGPIDAWTAKQSLPSPWMIGGADLAVWKVGNQTSYAIRVDPIRALLVRIYLMIGGDNETAASFRINSAAEQPIAGDDRAHIVALVNGLPPGDLLAVQREGGRGAFPPIGRPAASSLRIANDTIDVVARAEASMNDQEVATNDHEVATNGQEVATNDQAVAADAKPPTPKFARNALLTAWFATPPRQMDDLNRLFGAKVGALVTGGGEVVLYEVEGKKLLPRPRGVFVLPADDARRQAVQSIAGIASEEVRAALGFHIQTAEAGGELLVAFDDTSIPAYQKDAFDAPSFAANRWALRLDAQRFIPVLEQLDRSPGLRIATPRLYRSAKDLRHWIDALREARSIEAADSVAGANEELRVRIASK
jgi:hypothetical protein